MKNNEDHERLAKLAYRSVVELAKSIEAETEPPIPYNEALARELLIIWLMEALGTMCACGTWDEYQKAVLKGREVLDTVRRQLPQG
jgi:hypothetical protein